MTIDNWDLIVLFFVVGFVVVMGNVWQENREYLIRIITSNRYYKVGYMHFYIRTNESCLVFVDNERIMDTNERSRKPFKHFKEGTANHDAMIALTTDT